MGMEATKARKKILIVDDDPTLLELLKFTFSSSGFEVAGASGEEDFRREAQGARPDAIVLDIMLGEKNGVQVYERLLREGFDPKIPVVFLSVLARDISQTPPRSGRTYALVAKPFDPEKLVREITTLLN